MHGGAPPWRRERRGRRHLYDRDTFSILSRRLTRAHCCPDYEGQNVWDAADAGEWSLDLAEAACASIQEVAPDVPGVAEGGTMKELCKFPGLILIVSRASIAGIWVAFFQGCQQQSCEQDYADGFRGGVSRHDIAAIWVAFFSRWQRDRC